MKVTNSNRVFNPSEVDSLRAATRLATARLDWERAQFRSVAVLPLVLWAAGSVLARHIAMTLVMSQLIGIYGAIGYGLTAPLFDWWALGLGKAQTARNKAAKAQLDECQAEYDAAKRAV